LRNANQPIEPVAAHGAAPAQLFVENILTYHFEGQRSSRLNIQYRVIYSIEKEKFSVYVIDITPHKY